MRSVRDVLSWGPEIGIGKIPELVSADLGRFAMEWGPQFHDHVKLYSASIRVNLSWAAGVEIAAVAHTRGSRA